jgi:hypothetical protein
MKSEYFKCECGCGVLCAEYNSDWGLELAMFERNTSRSWWNRIKLACSALRGKPYTDMIILSDQQIADLVDYLFVIQNQNYHNKHSIHAIVRKLHEHDSGELIDALVRYIKLLPRNTHATDLLDQLKPLQY